MSEGDRTLGVRATTPAATSVRTACAPADLAWLLAAPCALVVLAAIVLLGPPLGDLLFPPTSIAFWPTAYVTLAIRPEPAEQARFLLALAGPCCCRRSSCSSAAARAAAPRDHRACSRRPARSLLAAFSLAR